MTANSGLDSLARWHDLIGTFAVVAGMAGLLGLAWLWKFDSLSSMEVTEATKRQSSFAGQLMALAWLMAVFGFT